MGKKTQTNISPERIERLEEIGFEWVGKAIRHDMVFEKHHRVLVVFKDEFGQCNVPYDYEGNPSLVSWCKTREEHTHTHKTA